MKDLNIEVLTPEGWRPAKLELRVGPKGELGLKVEFEGVGIAMSLSRQTAELLAHTLAQKYILEDA